MGKQAESQERVMYSWRCSSANNNGTVDRWEYVGKGRVLATVDRISGELPGDYYMYYITGTKIEGCEKTRSSAMIRARQEWERWAFG
jgi:hypothetical protein